jgi:hypothetical protein
MKLELTLGKFTPGEFEENSGNKMLFGFDYGSDLIHVMLCPNAPHGGAVAIWREGSGFAARISLNDLAVFALGAEKEQAERMGKS